MTMKRLLVAVLTALAPLAGYAGTYTFSSTDTNLTQLAHGTSTTWGLSGTQYTSLLSAVQTGQNVTGATLTISNIYDWTVESSDVLYVNVLSGLNAGVTAATWETTVPTNDTSYGADPFAYNSSSTSAYAKLKATGLAFNDAAANSLLTYTGSYNTAGNPGTWSDPNGGVATGFNLVVNLTAANLSVLQSFLAADNNGATNPNVGLGFGPECHYFDTGVSLSVTTSTPVQTIPDNGSTLVMMGAALVGLVGLRRRLTKRNA